MNYIDLLPDVISTITGCVSISAFASLVGIPIGVTSSATGLKICVITAGIKKCKPINKKKRKRNMIKYYWQQNLNEIAQTSWFLIRL